MLKDCLHLLGIQNDPALQNYLNNGLANLKPRDITQRTKPEVNYNGSHSCN